MPSCNKCKIIKDISLFRLRGYDNRYMRICKLCEAKNRSEAYQRKKSMNIYEPVVDLENEIWKDISQFEGYYQISNMGRIKRLTRIIKHVTGFNQSVQEKILKPSKRKYGYLEVTLVKEKIFTYKLVHILVAKAFLPNTENKGEVNHLFGIKDDNRSSQLEWTTHKENCIHRSTVLKRNNFSGEDNKLSKPIQIISPNGNIFIIKGIKETSRRIAEVSHSGIRSVLRGDTKTHKGYKFKYI